MPIVEVTLMQGRTPEQVRKMIEAITSVMIETVEARRESVRVIVREVPSTHWGVGGVPVADRTKS